MQEIIESNFQTTEQILLYRIEGEILALMRQVQAMQVQIKEIQSMLETGCNG